MKCRRQLIQDNMKMNFTPKRSYLYEELQQKIIDKKLERAGKVVAVIVIVIVIMSLVKMIWQ